MKIIVGLGNKGNIYDNTRHNIGFSFIDKIAEEFDINLNKNKCYGLYGEKVLYDEKILLVKPLTYMNLSGECIKAFFNFYKELNIEDLLVICDDINIPLGSIKIKKKGSSGGQNGLKNIIENLNTNEFARIRIGIGRPIYQNLSDYVLGRFDKEEISFVLKTLEQAKQAFELFIKNKNVDIAMNLFNKKLDY